MIKINNNNVIFVDQIVRYQKSPMHETTYIKSKTYKEYTHGSFLEALFHWDFSKKDVTLYFTGAINYLLCIGDWSDVEKYCANSKEHSVIDGKIYDMPYITFYLSDGSERTMFFKSNQEMRKMERQIIIKKKKH